MKHEPWNMKKCQVNKKTEKEMLDEVCNDDIATMTCVEGDHIPSLVWFARLVKTMKKEMPNKCLFSLNYVHDFIYPCPPQASLQECTLHK